MKMIAASLAFYMLIVVTCVSADHLQKHPEAQCDGCEPSPAENIAYPEIGNTDQRVQNLRTEYSAIVIPDGENYYPFNTDRDSEFDFQWNKFNDLQRIFNEDKRGTKFSSWGGKRAESIKGDAQKKVLKDTKGDKRYNNQFHSWGGKRSVFSGEVNFVSLLQELDKLLQRVRYTIIRIQSVVDDEYAFQHNVKHVKRSVIPLVMENTDKVQHFLKLADKGLEEKKRWKINAFRENLEKTHRRGSDFFSWGGKRNDKSTSGLK